MGDEPTFFLELCVCVINCGRGRGGGDEERDVDRALRGLEGGLWLFVEARERRMRLCRRVFCRNSA
jgi:hypothetical protein